MAEENVSQSGNGTMGRGPGPGIIQVPTDLLKAVELNVRNEIASESIETLAGSIARVGLINPITVTEVDGVLTVVSGHRRLAAVTYLGWETVPCLVREASASQIRETVFAENYYRQDISPVEQACAIKDAIDSGASTVDQVAGGFHRSSNWVRSQLAMLDWPAEVLAAVHVGGMSMAAASNLALVTDDVYREFLVRTAVEQGATARVTAAWLQSWRSQAPQEEAIEAEPVPVGAAIEPMIPQAPCFTCGSYERTDALSMVPLCMTCLQRIKESQRT